MHKQGVLHHTLKKKAKVQLEEIKKKKTKINSKLFKKCILFPAVQSELLVQRVEAQRAAGGGGPCEQWDLFSSWWNAVRSQWWP